MCSIVEINNFIIKTINNQDINYISGVIVALYGSYVLNIKSNYAIQSFLNNFVVRLILILSIVYIANYNFVLSIIIIVFIVFVGGIVLNFILGPLKFIIAFLLGIITSLWIF